VNLQVAISAGVGIVIVVLSTLLSELWWLIIRPRTPNLAMACWLVGIFTRIIVALAGIAFCVTLLDLPAPPLVLMMVVGYAIALAIETKLTIARLNRLQKK